MVCFHSTDSLHNKETIHKVSATVPLTCDLFFNMLRFRHFKIGKPRKTRTRVATVNHENLTRTIKYALKYATINLLKDNVRFTATTYRLLK